MNVTIVRDLRKSFGAARDQKTRPTCLAFAISDTHGSLHMPFKSLSVEYLYYNAVQLMTGRNPHGGINIDCACKSLASNGQPPEESWPYLAAVPAELRNWTPPKGCAVYKRKASIYQYNFKQICAQLDLGTSVVVCMELSESFYTPMADGIILQKSPDQKTGTHAVIAVGHGLTSSGPCLLIRNSWGPSWGLGGHAFLDEGYLATRILSTSTLS
jgi:hypothetical protein